MLRTYQNLIDRARILLQDENASLGLRYSTASLESSVEEALAEVFRLRPDAFLAVNMQLPDTWAPDDVLPVDPQFFQPLLYFVVGYQMLREDEYSKDSRAVAMMQMAAGKLVTGAA